MNCAKYERVLSVSSENTSCLSLKNWWLENEGVQNRRIYINAPWRLWYVLKYRNEWYVNAFQSDFPCRVSSAHLMNQSNEKFMKIVLEFITFYFIPLTTFPCILYKSQRLVISTATKAGPPKKQLCKDNMTCFETFTNEKAFTLTWVQQKLISSPCLAYVPKAQNYMIFKEACNEQVSWTVLHEQPEGYDICFRKSLCNQSDAGSTYGTTHLKVLGRTAPRVCKDIYWEFHYKVQADHIALKWIPPRRDAPNWLFCPCMWLNTIINFVVHCSELDHQYFNVLCNLPVWGTINQQKGRTLHTSHIPTVTVEQNQQDTWN